MPVILAQPIMVPPTPGLIISGVGSIPLSDTTAQIEWFLSDYATGQVEYGLTTAYGSLSTLEATYAYNHHIQQLSGLTAGTTYHYRVRSTTATGRSATSADYTFTTSASGLTRPWALPVTSGTVTITADTTGATDVTSTVNSQIVAAGNGKIIDFPFGTYKMSGPIDLRGKDNLIFEFNGSTINNVHGFGGLSEQGSCFLTQTPDYSGGISSHITIRNLIFDGNSPTPGVLCAHEHAHVLSIYAGSYYELDNVTGQDLHGDLMSVTQNGQYIWVHDCDVTANGRMSVSVVYGSHVLIENNSFGPTGWGCIDIEPESASNGGEIADIEVRNNTFTSWDYGFGFFFGCENGSATTVLVKDVYIHGNTVSAEGINSLIRGVAGHTRRQNIRVYDNVGAGTASPTFGGMTGVIAFNRVDTVYAYNNTQTVTGGFDLYESPNCTDVHIT